MSSLTRRRLERPNLKDTVAAEIRERIFSGDLRPDSKIDQDQLSEELGVSRLPIREALISLEREGLVRNVARKGAYVAPLTRRDIRDHFELYGRVSALAAERACEAMDEETLQELEDILIRMEELDEPEVLEELNFEFHRLINLSSGSPRVLSVIGLLAESIPTRFYEVAKGWEDLAYDHHREILAALKNGDSGAAGAAMEKHLTSSAEYAVRSLESEGFWDTQPDEE